MVVYCFCMDQRLKNYLGVGGILALTAFSFSAVFLALSYAEANRPVLGNFSVSAEGKIVAVPDIAVFTFSVLTQGDTRLAKLQQENTGKANETIAYLKQTGIESKDIKTERYAIEPRYQNVFCRPGAACPPPEIVGYTVHQTISVKIRDFTKIGDVLTGVVQKGANTVSELSFAVDDPEELENKVRAEALEKAQEKARALAKSGGFRLGKLLAIEEGGVGPRLFQLQAVPKGGGFGGESAPLIEPGSQELTVTMTLTYEMKQ